MWKLLLFTASLSNIFEEFSQHIYRTYFIAMPISIHHHFVAIQISIHHLS